MGLLEKAAERYAVSAVRPNGLLAISQKKKLP